ncbi:MAG TPA: hypothetical protein V6C97_03530 [Oculatellaceae cyanobacterium]
MVGGGQERKKESVCVCVCVREREREREQPFQHRHKPVLLRIRTYTASSYREHDGVMKPKLLLLQRQREQLALQAIVLFKKMRQGERLMTKLPTNEYCCCTRRETCVSEAHACICANCLSA